MALTDVIPVTNTVLSPTLQRLTIKHREGDGFDEVNCGSIAFDTPSLVSLEYIDVVADEYPIVNLDQSLVEAKLDLTFAENLDPTNLFTGLRNVEILSLLSFYTFEVSVL